jgi:phosphoribosyl-ATP pyrophosphohydrolase/phosphoribosyl-AMP cyclohydrolase
MIMSDNINKITEPLTVEELVERIDWEKVDGLVPAIIQDVRSKLVLMLGYMSREALRMTVNKGLVTFWSRTQKKLWTKGETSGNVINVCSITPDCDNDTLLVKGIPTGPVCHTGDLTCWKEVPKN